MLREVRGHELKATIDKESNVVNPIEPSLIRLKEIPPFPRLLRTASLALV